MVPDEHSLLADSAGGIQHWDERLETLEDCLHTSPVGGIIQVGSQHHHL